MKSNNFVQFSILVFEIILFLIFFSLIRLCALSIDNFLINAWDTVWKLFLFIGFIYFLFLFYRISAAERKILALYANRDKEISTVSGETVSMRIIDGRTRNIELQFQEEISHLERRRKYDLEKIPFLRK